MRETGSSQEKDMRETGSSQEKDIFTSSDVINANCKSLTAKNNKDEHSDETIDDCGIIDENNSPLIIDESNHISTRENNNDVSSIFYKNYEKDDVLHSNQLIDNKWKGGKTNNVASTPSDVDSLIINGKVEKQIMWLQLQAMWTH